MKKTQTLTKELQSTTILKSMGIEPDDYPADACFNVDGSEYIGTYSKDRQTVCMMIADNMPCPDMLSKELIQEIAYTCKKLITNFGCEVHSYTMKNIKPFTNLTIEKVSAPEPTPVPTTGGELPDKLELSPFKKGMVGTGFDNPIDTTGHFQVFGSNPEPLAAEIAKRYNSFPAMLEALTHIIERTQTVRPNDAFCHALRDIAKEAIK